MKGGNISGRPFPYVLFNFHEVVEVTKPRFEFMAKLTPSRYWKPLQAGKVLMDRFFDEHTVCVLVYSDIKDAAEKWLLENTYMFNKVVVIRDKQSLDEFLTSPEVMGVLSKEGKDGFGRTCSKMVRWSELR